MPSFHIVSGPRNLKQAEDHSDNFSKEDEADQQRNSNGHTRPKRARSDDETKEMIEEAIAQKCQGVFTATFGDLTEPKPQFRL